MHVKSFRNDNISENNGLNSNPVCCLAKQGSADENWVGQYYTTSTMMAKAHSAVYAVRGISSWILTSYQPKRSQDEVPKTHTSSAVHLH